MIPVSFDRANGVLDKPASLSRDECEPLNVFMGFMLPELYPVTISCWKFTAEELEQVKKTGRIYLTMMSHSVPPVALSTEMPENVDGPEDLNG